MASPLHFTLSPQPPTLDITHSTVIITIADSPQRPRKSPASDRSWTSAPATSSADAGWPGGTASRGHGLRRRDPGSGRHEVSGGWLPQHSTRLEATRGPVLRAVGTGEDDVRMLTVCCGWCGRDWPQEVGWSEYYAREAIETKPCPCCGAYTLACPEPPSSASHSRRLRRLNDPSRL